MNTQTNMLGGGPPPSGLINQFVQGLAGYSSNIQIDRSKGLSENDRDFLESQKVISRQIAEASFRQAEQERIRQYNELQAQKKNELVNYIDQQQISNVEPEIREQKLQVQPLSNTNHVEISLDEETKNFFTHYFSDINNNLMTIIELLKENNRPDNNFEEFILGGYDDDENSSIIDEKEIDSKVEVEE